MSALVLCIGCVVLAFAAIFVLAFIEKLRGTSAPNINDLTGARTRLSQGMTAGGSPTVRAPPRH
jgi:hypothetical protein